MIEIMLVENTDIWYTKVTIRLKSHGTWRICMKYSIEELQNKKEDQTFDRKSVRKDPKSLSNHIVAFANADGGTLVIGIEDNGEITGIDAWKNQINEILRIPFDFCKPSVLVESEFVPCKDKDGNENHILIMTIPQSTELHANQQDDVYYRMGDKSQRLSFEDRLRLMYAKGSRYFEDEPVADSSIEDIDMEFVSSYCKKIGYSKSPKEYILQNKSLTVTKGNRQEMSGAAILLFGKDPQRFFPRARIRIIRYDGIEAKVGAEMNVIKDRTFTGRILNQVETSLAFLRDQIKEYTYLGADGKFVTRPEYPEFAWKELVVNAIAHRDYSIKGTDIQIKIFDDHLVVESPGNLPGIVRLHNMRQVHFSRNPKIAALLQDYDYVQEFGEGVDRMYNEMELAGLPEPEYRNIAFMLNATIWNRSASHNATNGANPENLGANVTDFGANQKKAHIIITKSIRKVYDTIAAEEQISAKEIAEQTGITLRTVQRCIKTLTDNEYIERKGNRKSITWVILRSLN